MAKKPETAKAKKTGEKANKKAASPASSPTTAAASKAAGKPRGLGRGLSSLLGDAGVAAATGTSASQAAVIAADGVPAAALSGLSEIPVEWINVGPWQPRRRFDKERLAELAESIRAKGLVQPILVRPQDGSNNRYQLIAGERRWRAAQMAQLHVIPAIIRPMSDEEAHELALIENIQRADLSAVEEAEGYRQLIDKFGYTQEQLSEIIGKSRSHIANLLRLLVLPADVCAMVVDGKLTMGQVRPLIGHSDCVALAHRIVEKGLSARQVEALVKSQKSAPSKETTNTAPAREVKSADIRALEEEMQSKLGLRLDLDWNVDKERGRLVMHFNSLEQFEAIMAKLEKD